MEGESENQQQAYAEGGAPQCCGDQEAQFHQQYQGTAEYANGQQQGEQYQQRAFEETQQQRAGEATQQQPAGEATQQQPAGEATQQQPAGEATQQQPAGEATQQQPAGEATQQQPAGEATQQQPAGEATQQQPAGEATQQQPAGEATQQQRAGEATQQQEGEQEAFGTQSYIREGMYVGQGQDYWPAQYPATDAAGGFTKLPSTGSQPRCQRLKSILKKGSTLHQEHCARGISFGPGQVWDGVAGDPPVTKTRSLVYSDGKNVYVDATAPNGPVQTVVQLNRGASVDKTIADVVEEKRRQRKMTQIEAVWDRYQQRGNLASEDDGWVANLGMPRVAMRNLPPRYDVKYPDGDPRSTACGGMFSC
ncbi:hypothetical protein BESB_026920 [Besnoitia besnoiti]|uniref:Uncharacterized protein n=1 Tax=Besnoitia besnoiti TaxID=94643 RepID=A0A2A9LZ80_BESBE|nr:uncharacterized protein BESB_026920 [Besnoitia besnoiti]PFH31718.1 hypothetical protein BESB_026920 [Besnoitia besnoiti]